MLLTNISITIVAFLSMEGVAWFTHKFVMHGFLWNLHKDHHDHSNKKVEKNDFFFLIFALPSIIMTVTGFQTLNFWFFIGFGIFLYGLAYFVVHDIIIHRRLKYFNRLDNKYIKGIRMAHKVHHKRENKEHGSNFGMLFIPFKYLRENSDIR